MSIIFAKKYNRHRYEINKLKKGHRLYINKGKAKKTFPLFIFI